MSKINTQTEISAPTFWEQYKRKPLGMVGLVIVLVYVFVALFAPFLTPYNPKQILLADRIAAPVWFRSVVPQYDDAPSTIRTTLGPDEWAVSEATGGKLVAEELEGNAISIIEFDPVARDEGISEDEVDTQEYGYYEEGAG